MKLNSTILKMENVLITSHLAGTTVDSIELSPYIVARDVDTIIRDDICDRVVNYRKLQGV